jgi:hypothetical protein
MADYSAMKSYLGKNNLQYFTFSRNSEKPIKAAIRHLPPDTPAEDISNSLENLGFNQREAIDDQSKSTKWINLRGKPPAIPCHLKEKRKIPRDIQAE